MNTFFANVFDTHTCIFKSATPLPPPKKKKTLQNETPATLSYPSILLSQMYIYFFKLSYESVGRKKQ